MSSDFTGSAFARAVSLMGSAGWDAETDSALSVCDYGADLLGTTLHQQVANLEHAKHRVRLEFAVKMGDLPRLEYLLDDCGAFSTLVHGCPPPSPAALAAAEAAAAAAEEEEPPASPPPGAPRSWCAPRRPPWRPPPPPPLPWRWALFDEAPLPGHLRFEDSVQAFPVWPPPPLHAAAVAALRARLGGGPYAVARRPSGEIDFGPPITGPLAAWRRAHPHAEIANIQLRNDLTSADFAHLAGVKALNMSGISNTAVTPAAFKHLVGLVYLVASGCTQLSDAHFFHLETLRSLFMGYSSTPLVTDSAFAHLGSRGLFALCLAGCTQGTITGEAFGALAHTLCYLDISYTRFSPEVRRHLNNLRRIFVCGVAGNWDWVS
jgi:hypothetical protein